MIRHLALAITLLCSSALAADPGLSLLRPDGLEGWDYGPRGAGGWRIAEGVLSGDQNAAPLLSGWTLGEFELDGESWVRLADPHYRISDGAVVADAVRFTKVK